MSSLSTVEAVALLISPQPGSGLADVVGQQLADAIHLGLFARGEQLPSEAALAGQLGVSTVTLREALAMLRSQGLVETRRGRHGGTFICGPVSASLARLRARLRDTSVVELRDLGDEWSAIGGAAARLAATRASNDQITRLHQLATELGTARSVGERGRAHSRFSVELALASQSERLTRAQLRLEAEAGDLLWIPCAKSLDPHAVALDLHAIADAVGRDDHEQARQLTELRIQRDTRWLISAHLELVDQ
jgi:GntR family transcriptional regulator, transcriptional repressor for pyruvate dehydrogenase complex